jgi:cellulose biosynthesis protein BcsQ
VIAFFNNKGGVGKTSMVYHLGWMFADRGRNVIVADLDPQSNLTAAFLDEERLEEVFARDDHSLTIFGCVQPLKRATGDILPSHVEAVADRLGLVPGDMALSTFEDQLSEVWPKCLDRDERAFRVTSAFSRILQDAARRQGAEVIFIDLGPNLGAINRAALIASSHVVIPLGPDLFSLQGLRNLGPTLIEWRRDWRERLQRNPAADLVLPEAAMQPIGYVVLRHSIRLDRPVKAYERWIQRIPGTYSAFALGLKEDRPVKVADDPNCIARLKDYRSLMPLAQEARKPMFSLKPADGALGAHTAAVADAYKDFLHMARDIARRVGISQP